jgi:hypothetical protein
MSASTMEIGVETVRVRSRARMPDPVVPEDPDIDPEPERRPETPPPAEPYPPLPLQEVSATQ